MSHTSNLDIWSFYCTEALAHGTSYDMELMESELRDEDDQDEIMTSHSSQRRRVVNGCYDNIELMQPAYYQFILTVSFF